MDIQVCCCSTRTAVDENVLALLMQLQAGAEQLHKTSNATSPSAWVACGPTDAPWHACCVFVQTDVYLEELTDVVPETDNTTQTDAFLERPPTPKFVPAKSGVDAATQIEDGKAACHSPVPKYCMVVATAACGTQLQAQVQLITWLSLIAVS